MPDFNFEPPHSRRPPPGNAFWIDVWKIALGIFLGSVISFLFCGLIAFLATFVWQGMNAPRATPSDRAAAAPADDIKRMIGEYQMLAKSKAIESDKAMVAESIADAYRERGDRKTATEWDAKAKKHEAASAAGRKMGPPP